MDRAANLSLSCCACLLWCAFIACGGGPTVVPAPPGPDAADELPSQPGDAQALPGDSHVAVDAPDDAEPDDVPRGVPDGDSDGDWSPGGPDQGPPVGTGAVGEPCYKDDQCDGDGLCLDWPQGYCSFVNCPTVFQCPGGSACVSQGGGTTACLRLCTEQADCRDGYGCKPFTDVEGNLVRGCYALAPEPAPAGGACEEHSDCEGPFACLTFVPDGYCALLGCGGAAACPEGTACVGYNGTPTCLRECSTKDDCLVGGAEARICGPLLDAQNQVAMVCIPAVDGVGVGSECSTDIECSTNECRIVAEGKCVGSDLGCFADPDCPGAGLCELAPAYVEGICTQACAGDVACPGTSLCVATSGGPAWCSKPCSGKGDLVACDKGLGEICVFGDPIASTTGAGKFACAVLKAGDPGTECLVHEDCKGGGCIVAGGAGVCAPPCGAGLFCPFPTVCVQDAGVPEQALRCMRRCFSVQDCPGSLLCQTTPTSASKVCTP